jgi:hypothetical protein
MALREEANMTTRISILSVAAALGLACAAPGPKTPEEKKAKGDQILREMSTSLSAVKTFSFTAEEVSEKVGTGGQKTPVTLVRHVTVRRPDGFTFKTEGGAGTTFWYDGTHATIVSDEKKLYARGPMPKTLDETLDYAAAVYDLRLPWADLLYGSPYEALVSADTTGGWVGTEKIEGTDCDHLSYQNPVVDWDIWVTQARHGVKRLQITYKEDPGKPVTRVTFKDENLAPTVDASTFTAKVPEGYTRIHLARRDSDLAPIETADAAPAPEASPASTPAPQ